MAKKTYYVIAPEIRIKLETGKRSLNPQTGNVEQIPGIKLKLVHPERAAIGYELDEIVKKVEDQNAGFKVTNDFKKKLEEKLDRLVSQSYMATSRGDYMAKTQGPEGAAESYKVDALSRQIDDQKEVINVQGKLASDQAAEIERLKEELKRKRN